MRVSDDRFVAERRRWDRWKADEQGYTGSAARPTEQQVQSQQSESKSRVQVSDRFKLATKLVPGTPINCNLTALLELGFPLAVFDDFFAVVAHRQCHWGVCLTRPAEMDVYVTNLQLYCHYFVNPRLLSYSMKLVPAA